VRIAPAGGLTPELRDRILLAKPELLQLLSPRPSLDRGLAVREVLNFPAALLPQLPIPTTLVLELPGMGSPVLVATHAGCPPRSFDVDEWMAMTALAAEGAASLMSLKRWFLGNRRVELSVATRRPGDAMHVVHVIAAYGCTLRAVVLDGGVQL
jgi:hypothetical protein